ncbi:MAG: SWIM zinc finger family protein [Bacteroidota bacterium]|nr:SWIM zinc finger family protein [Bacteroidota bacterium]
MKRKNKSDRRQWLTEENLFKYAGEPSYSRGVEYYEDGHVLNISVESDEVLGVVQGEYTYHVHLWEKDNDLEYSCSCPFFKENAAFCKHCVAVGLAYLNSSEEISSSNAKSNIIQTTTDEDIKTYIEKLDKSDLVALIVDHAKEDKQLRDKLKLRVAASGKIIHLPAFKRSIDDAVGSGEFIHYHSMYGYYRGILQVISSIRTLLNDGHCEEVIELTEYFLQKAEKALNSLDDSDGYMSDVLEELQELHHQACLEAKPDPKKLAEKLFNREISSEWEVFYGATQTYADVLGSGGLAVYQSLVEAKWKQLPNLEPGESRFENFYRERFRLQRIMESLAKASGDVEALVAVKTKDLSSSYSFLQIAEIYKEAGKADKSLEWAEKGVAAFPNQIDSRLQEFLANEYHERDHHQKAMKLIWKIFAERPGLNNFKILYSHALKCDDDSTWQSWRTKALTLIREQIDEVKRKAARHQGGWMVTDHSTLVEIFLWEKEYEQAWEEAQAGGCKEHLWIELAKIREKNYPEDSLAVYKTLVEPFIERKNNESYQGATSFIRKIKILSKQLGRNEDWDIFLTKLKTDHRRKRNFIALLKKVE